MFWFMLAPPENKPPIKYKGLDPSRLSLPSFCLVPPLPFLPTDVVPSVAFTYVKESHDKEF